MEHVSIEVYKALNEIREYVSRKEMDQALKLSAELVERADALCVDESAETFAFKEFFEEVIYIYYNRPTTVLRRAEFPYADVYLQHGSNLVECGKYMEAREVLEKARRWAPVNCDIAFEYMETFKAMGEMEEFARLTKQTYKYAFHVPHIARCYRNMGYYFTEKEKYAEAIMCYMVSTQFENSDVAQREITFINSKIQGKELHFGSKEEIEESIGLSTEVFKQNVEIALAYGQHFLDKGEKNGARYCIALAYQMTGNPSIREKLESIPE